MAVERDDLRTIFEALSEGGYRERLLILGDALIHVQPADLPGLAAEAAFELGELPDQLDPFTLGRVLGFAHTDTLDVNGRASLRIDLHKSPPEELRGAYDCVIDAGVLFWCSDPGAALRSILTMTKVGGTIVHICAVSGHYGRGYYNVHPLLFEDFYLTNGCSFRVATFRPKFRPRGIARYRARLLRIRNEVTRRNKPGGVYLDESRPNRITFASRYRNPIESNIVANNVLGVFVFTKESARQIEMPLRSTPYDETEREGKTPQ